MYIYGTIDAALKNTGYSLRDIVTERVSEFDNIFLIVGEGGYVFVKVAKIFVKRPEEPLAGTWWLSPEELSRDEIKEFLNSSGEIK